MRTGYPKDLGATGALVRARHVFGQIWKGEGETAVLPRASQNVTVAAMIMLLALEPSSDEGKHIHKELQGLLEVATMQQATSSAERRWPDANAGLGSCGHGASSGPRAEVGARPAGNETSHGREVSPAHSRFCGNCQACSASNVQHCELGPVGRDWPRGSSTEPRDPKCPGKARTIDAA